MTYHPFPDTKENPTPDDDPKTALVPATRSACLMERRVARACALWYTIAGIALASVSGCRIAKDETAIGLRAAKMASLSEVQERFKAGDPGPLFDYLETVGPDADTATHFVAGDFLFGLGELERAREEHVAAASTELFASLGAWEAVVDHLVLRRFPDACHWLERVPALRLREPGTEAIHAAALLRCGDPVRALAILRDLRADRHSSAEEGLASAFGEQRRFAAYRFKLERPSGASQSAVQKRALAELLLCGDYSNPWHPRFTYDEAVQLFDEIGGCAASGRAAVAEMLRTERRTSRRGTVETLSTMKSRLDPYMQDGPTCPEVAEAYFLYLDSVDRDGEGVRNLLLRSVERFPDTPMFRKRLLDLYRLDGTEAKHVGEMKSMSERWPKEWFPYVRLAALEVAEGKEEAAAKWLETGLSRIPGSMALNYLLAMLRLKQHRFEDATQGAARYLAGLLETRKGHHDWDSGIALLQFATSKRSPWPEDAIQTHEVLTRLFREPAVDAAAWRVDHGCFTPSGSSVGDLPEWFKPDLVLAALP